MASESFSRVFLIAYGVIYFLVCFVGRTLIVRKRLGKNPFVLGHSDSPYDYIGKIFNFILLLIAASMGFYCGAPGVYNTYLGRLEYLERAGSPLPGIVLLCASLLWTAIAQAQMGLSWRIGIDRENRTELVQAGLFRLSRNPIFLGMNGTAIGIFLITPNALSLSAAVLAHALTNIQVRLEEEHLERLHGPRYLAFKRRVRRWI